MHGEYELPKTYWKTRSIAIYTTKMHYGNVFSEWNLKQKSNDSKNWTESMRMAVHIMRKFRVEKIESTTFENDIEDVHWEDKACLRRAFGFKAE
ncbi:unnamed protein product [Caenorhabditis angaria]|uniref:Uncharacterized protein n=1 Tax=Caenorhabditis angaria TaxID=860376 RepID=A0A9P1J2T7_9PELO|nr:unnamed protein product [Caenorhabditis angaria]